MATTTTHGNRADKHPFLPETRNVGNMGCCAACGQISRCTQRSGANGFYTPADWTTRSIDGPDGMFLVYTCDRCTALHTDGSSAREFYDRHTLRWSPSNRSWEAIPVAPSVPVAKENEEISMTTNGAGAGIEKPSFKAKAIGQAKDLGGAAALGIKLAATDEVGEMFIDLLKEFGKNNPMIAALLEDESGREIAKLLMATATHTMCEHTSMVPQSEFVKKAAELQVTASFETLAKPQMKNVRKAMGKLALIGQKMAEIEGGATTEAEEEEEASTSSVAKATAKR